MGAPVSGMEPAEQANALLSPLKHISASERRKHATVFNYWLSIRRDRDLPPIRDLDPLEISDAGPSSILLELIGGGEDAEIRHVGEMLKGDDPVRIVDAPPQSVLSCIAGKLAIVAISSNALAFEDEYATADGTARCCVTLLPFSSTGTWVDYVYAFVSLVDVAGPVDETPAADEPDLAVDDAPPAIETEQEPVPEPEALAPEPEFDAVAEDIPDCIKPEPEAPVAEILPADDFSEDVEPAPEAYEPEPDPAEAATRPGFSSTVFDALAGVAGYFGTVVNAEPKLPEAPVGEDNTEEAAEELPEEPADEIAEEPIKTMEDSLQSKLTEVRGKADEARMAKLQSDAALLEGLSAAYDFALDAEDKPEEYLKLVEQQGLKIQLRSPMAPVVKLAFQGSFDDGSIAELEAVLAWALKQDLPRGTLAERIDAEGGISSILNGQARAA